MNRKYEVFIDGRLAKRHLTFAGAEKTLAKFPLSKGQIYKIIPTVQVILLVDRAPLLQPTRSR